MDLNNYLPVLLFLFVGSLVGIGPMVIGKLLGPSRPDPEKLSAYEYGFEAFGDARMQVDIRYYLVAILFILFDLEIAFLFPWAVSLGTIGFIGFMLMMVFPRLLLMRLKVSLKSLQIRNTEKSLVSISSVLQLQN